ncbi:MAG TPA: extracellular solute-binding protein [Sphingomicrobium sp.]|nr:extracellular solute-binding protein [Sphingomicrobium sp.]
MKRALPALLAALLLGGCGKADRKEAIYLQRFFGECTALYGNETDVAKAEGECGIITTLINRYNAEHPTMRVSQNVVAWPGYPQLTAQVAAKDPPDLVSMHSGVISDYASKGLLEPVEPILRAAGVDPASFTAASRKAVTIDGRIYGLPWDTHGGLFHINLALFRKAGLMRGGRPILPSSAEELLRHARLFKQRTGKPYLIQSLVGDNAYQTRNLYTYLMAQNAVIFPDAKHVRLQTAEARRIVEFFRRISVERLTTLNQDTPAAIGSFMNGDGGIYPTGTWMIGQFEQESKTPGRPLYGSYGVYPYPRLWGRQASFVSGHVWVVPSRRRTEAQRAALAAFFRFMAAHNFDWVRTGHLPAFKNVVASPKFRSLEHRVDIAPLAAFGEPLPGYVRRQNAIEGLIGEEVAAAVNGQKPIDRALADAERRVNDFLRQID